MVLFKPAPSVWVCATAFSEITDGISAEPASLDVTEISEPPLSGWMPNWSDDDPSWGTCATDLFFAPKLAWDVLCTRMLRHKNEDSTSVMDAFCVVSLLLIEQHTPRDFVYLFVFSAEHTFKQNRSEQTIDRSASE